MRTLEIKSLTKKFGEFCAVRDLNLQLESGNIYALLGPNGAGKTTTIKLIMGILQADEGSVEICECDMASNRMDALKRVGYLPDEPFFHDYLKGSEILRFVGEMFHMPLSKMEENVNKYVELFGLSDAIDDYAVNYSLGMKKRLGLIAAVMHEPELLILDEPINGLDPYGVKVLHQFLQEYVKGDRSIIYSTHILEQAEKLCNLVGIIYKGQLMKSTKLIALKSEYSHCANLEEIFFDITGHHVE